MSPLRAGLWVVAGVTLGVGLFLVLGSGLQYRASQSAAYALFRGELAAGTAPILPRQADRRPLRLGTPVALLTIPSLGLRAMVGEGTTGSVLADGPGHERSTVFPGGAGTSVIMGRAAAFGGPFGRLAQLRRGATIYVRTGAGEERFKVVDVRKTGKRIPVLASNAARLTLVTASGRAFFPSGVVWVDADAVGPPLPAAAPLVASVPSDERPLGTSIGSAWLLFMWLAILVLALVGAAFTWHFRGRAYAWIIFTAPVVVIGYVIADELARLLPNLT